MPIFTPTPGGLNAVVNALPTAASDSTRGFAIGSTWTYTGGFPFAEDLLCYDSTPGAAKWRYKQSVKTLFTHDIPLILPPGNGSSSTVASNGALTLGTALWMTVPECFMYFPAGFFTGASAGWYYVVMSSTTVGTVYQNQYTGGTPTTPAVLTPITTGQGAYTTTGSTVVSTALTVPAGTIGANDKLIAKLMLEAASNANSKSFDLYVGSTQMGGGGNTTSSSIVAEWLWSQQNSQQRQIVTQNPTSTASGSVFSYRSVNMAAQQTLSIKLAMTVNTDYMAVSAGFIELIRFPGSIT